MPRKRKPGRARVQGCDMGSDEHPRPGRHHASGVGEERVGPLSHMGQGPSCSRARWSDLGALPCHDHRTTAGQQQQPDQGCQQRPGRCAGLGKRRSLTRRAALDGLLLVGRLVGLLSSGSRKCPGWAHPECHHPECHHPECHHPECHHPECHHPECHHPECHHPECHHPECHHPEVSPGCTRSSEWPGCRHTRVSPGGTHLPAWPGCRHTEASPSSRRPRAHVGGGGGGVVQFGGVPVVPGGHTVGGVQIG